MWNTTSSRVAHRTPYIGCAGRRAGLQWRSESSLAAIRRAVGITHSRSRAESPVQRNSRRYDVKDTFDNNFHEPAIANGGRRSEPKALFIPYSHPASEFLFGRSVVEAALRASKRKLYKMYYLESGQRPLKKVFEADSLVKLAHAKGVEAHPLRGGDSLRLLDMMSKGRPHNVSDRTASTLALLVTFKLQGFVLEASPRHKLPVRTLMRCDPAAANFGVELGKQSREQLEVNGEPSVLGYSGSNRHAFVLFLDGIVSVAPFLRLAADSVQVDPGNLGAIIRSASFLGVDAIAISSHSVSLSPVVLKASAGAVESIPLLSVLNTGHFIESSRLHGWQFYAAVPPESKADHPLKHSHFLSSLGRPLAHHPCVLMLGSEGSGLWRDLIQRSNCLLTIPGRRAGEDGVDSLNVGAAAALMCETFLSPTFSSANELWN